MLILATGMNANPCYEPRATQGTPHNGFSLIELLVVLVIISIITSVAILALSDFGEDKRLIFSAEQLVKTLRLAQHQALLESSTLGLKIDNRGYQLLKFQDSSWKAMPNNALFKVHYFPEHTVIFLKTERPATILPALIIDASGDITPFVLKFMKKNVVIRVLQGTATGQLNFIESHKP